MLGEDKEADRSASLGWISPLPIESLLLYLPILYSALLSSYLIMQVAVWLDGHACIPASYNVEWGNSTFCIAMIVGMERTRMLYTKHWV